MTKRKVTPSTELTRFDKAERTTAAAFEAIDQERMQRLAKTARLQALRKQREATAGVPDLPKRSSGSGRQTALSRRVQAAFADK